MSTTYILGAGASFHAGYPFARTMGRELLNWMKGRESVYYDFPASSAFLESRFGDDIEAIMCGMERAIRRRTAERPLIANCHKPAFIEAMREWFAEIHQGNQASAYGEFAERIVQPGDTVITFNYDVSLDAKLRKAGKWEIGNGYGFDVEGLPSNSPVQLLKVHGSINWLSVILGGNRPAFTDDTLAALGYEGLVDTLFPRQGAAAILPLILPLNRKKFYFDTNLGKLWVPFWNRLWRAARRSVRRSNRIVICGYGMYPIDKRGCNLLLRGDCDADIEVCSGSRTDGIVSELRLHGRRAEGAEDRRFEQWVSTHAL
jgi:hypothetical protein